MRSDTPPLCVDLDGTLIRTDSLVESILELIRRQPLAVLWMPLWLLRGKARFKSEVAARVKLVPDALPYREPFLSWVREQARSRPVYLTTAAHHSVAEPIALHVGCFSGVIATKTINLSSRNKADALSERFGERQFDYAGNSMADIPVWRHARRSIVVGGSRPLVRRAQTEGIVEHQFDVGSASLIEQFRLWVRALRVYQWVKNLLIFLVPLAAHLFLDPQVFTRSLLAFFAFGLAASGAYIANDLIDLPFDRAHPRKRKRPFACGDLSALSGAVAVPVLLAMAFALGSALGAQFLLVLLLYLTSTMLYSAWLKRTLFLDVAVLAGLYTLRVIAGGVATQIGLSFWLLAMCAYGFLSLALLKRYAEVVSLESVATESLPGRSYTAGDSVILVAMGTAAGLVSTLVTALYVDSTASHENYTRPHFLWMLVALMMVGVGRLWFCAGRGRMHDDPIVFVARDRLCLALIAAGVLVVALAI
jgi:4-hydroxybenzoate polyprenyltransferase